MADDPNDAPWFLCFVPADGSPPNWHQVLRLTADFAASPDGQILPAFSTEELAGEFAMSFGEAIGVVLASFRFTRARTLDLTQYLHLHEVTHACLDPSATDRACTNLVPIAEFYDRFRDRGSAGD